MPNKEIVPSPLIKPEQIQKKSQNNICEGLKGLEYRKCLIRIKREAGKTIKEVKEEQKK